MAEGQQSVVQDLAGIGFAAQGEPVESPPVGGLSLLQLGASDVPCVTLTETHDAPQLKL
jgi:hypothetical protein